MDAAIELRRDLHRSPELSGAESGTARLIRSFFARLAPDAIVERIGGDGLAVVFDGPLPGPSVMLRCELDALPIQELNDFAHRSATPGVSHKCGHDGHMAILAAVGAGLARERPARGRVVLLFQPAEETGQGAAAVIADPRFEEIRPDFSFALHNLPGFPLGQVVLRDGVFSCASRGLAVALTGATAHAAQPETGVSPALALSRIVAGLTPVPDRIVPEDEIAFATVVGARLGDKAFGTAPADARVWATLRSETDATMTALVDYAERIVREAAAEQGLTVAVDYEDVFPATVNTPAASAIVRDALGPDRPAVPDAPFRWSEDFGHFTALADGAMFGIGAGESVPDLHNADYDFPDELIDVARGVFDAILKRCLA